METKPRILYLQKILLERTDEENPLSTTQLINILNDEYGISAHRTTVTKDIAALQEFGMDIVTIHSTQSKYFVASRKFELPELKLLIDAVESSKFITKKKSETLIEKIHTMTSPGQVAKLKRNNYVVNRIKPDNEQIYYIIDAINDAINAGKQISFPYYDYTGLKKKVLKNKGEIYKLSPYKLLWCGDYYYVLGYSEKKSKVINFRVDRIASKPEILDKDIIPILELRTQKGMSQDELAEKVFVSRQAVSRWENGDTVPNTETLKLLSKVFDVSINTLLGSPRKLICQCCGMPLEDDDIIGHNHDGSFNEDYCKWCYADGTYTYNDMDDLIEVCVKNMVNDNFTEEQARSYMKELLPTLDYWKKYDELSDNGQFEEFKQKLINEINELNVDGMPKVEKLNALVGKYVNLEYRLPNGQAAKFLNDAKTYLGNQLECNYGGDRCFGVVADMDFILICTYEEEGKNPELVLYKKR